MPSRADLLRWQRERRTTTLPPNPPADAFPFRVVRDLAERSGPSELIATWVGHSSWLLQLNGINILTDPQWSERASPVQWAGPRRLTPPGVPFDALPPVDLVLLSHDHYDHLDAPTVRRLNRRFGSRLRWATPLGYRGWFRRFDIVPVEMDWWDERTVETESGALDLRCLPAQHWCSRTPWDRMKRLWCSWAARSEGRSFYFGGDSGWFPEYGRIGAAGGPFDLTLLPIGAYEPRWFMRSSHMNPEDAVRAFSEIDVASGAGTLAGMHWGTFRLTDEAPLEPPLRLQETWRAAGLPAERLWLAALGESRTIDPSAERNARPGIAG